MDATETNPTSLPATTPPSVGTLSITVNVTVTGKPEEAEALAKAALAAVKILAPNVKVGE